MLRPSGLPLYRAATLGNTGIPRTMPDLTRGLDCVSSNLVAGHADGVDCVHVGRLFLFGFFARDDRRELSIDHWSSTRGSLTVARLDRVSTVVLSLARKRQ